MLMTVVAHQRLRDHFLARLDPRAAQLGQNLRIVFPGQNRIHDGQSSLPHNVADNVVQLKIHLIQCFLHMVDVRGGHLHQALPVPE